MLQKKKHIPLGPFIWSSGPHNDFHCGLSYREPQPVLYAVFPSAGRPFLCPSPPSSSQQSKYITMTVKNEFYNPRRPIYIHIVCWIMSGRAPVPARAMINNSHSKDALLLLARQDARAARSGLEIYKGISESRQRVRRGGASWKQKWMEGRGGNLNYKARTLAL